MTFGPPIPNAPFFSLSYVLTFLTRPDSPPKLGKRNLRLYHEPNRPEVSQQMRPRILASSRGKHNANQGEPWHGNDRFIRKFNRDEMVAVIEAQNLQFLVPDNCPIHPLLHPLMGITPDVPGVLPALRLATRFLSSRHTLTFFHNLLTTPLTILVPESLHYGVLLKHLSSPICTTMMNGLHDAERNLSLQVMVALTPHISLHISPDSRLSTRWAYTERATPHTYLPTAAYSTISKPWFTPAESKDSLLRHLNFSGTNALINLSPCFIRTLHPHNQAATDTHRLRAAYMLAVTLIHELAHAVYMCRFAGQPFPSLTPPATFRSDEYEPFFAEQRKSELGHALETCLFGGGKLLSLAQRDDFSVGLGWQRWPDAEDFYTLGKSGKVEALQRLGSETVKWETVYVVSDAWVGRQFEAKFWEQLEQEGLSGGLLNVNKVLGSRCRNYDFVGDGDGLTSGVSSRGRGVDGEGVVRPGQPFIESEDEELEDEEGEEGDEDEMGGEIGT